MAYREITDANGRTWRVWDTDPHNFGGRQVLAPGYASGWLTFECADEKRRLAPAPAGWDALTAAALLRLLEGAEVIDPHAKRLAEAGVLNAERGGAAAGSPHRGLTVPPAPAAARGSTPSRAPGGPGGP